MRSMGEYFESNTQSPKATEQGIFASPPMGGAPVRGTGEYFSDSQSPQATKEGSLGPPVRGTGEYWRGGSMPPAGAFREGVLGRPMSGMGQANGNGEAKMGATAIFTTLGLGAAIGLGLAMLGGDQAGLKPKYTDAQLAMGGALGGVVLFGVPMLLAYSMGLKAGKKAA